MKQRRKRRSGRQPDVTVHLGSLRLRNPLMLASGVAGYGHELGDVIDLGRVGAVVTKTLTLKPRQGNAPPRLAEVPSGLLNSIGLANVGSRAFISEHLDRLRNLDTRIIVSVGGFTVAEYAKLVLELEEVGGFDAYEVNISCPNVKAGGVNFGSTPGKAAGVVRALRSKTGRPLIVKLTPNVTDIPSVAVACESEGADALTVGNTFRAMAVDLDSRRPVLGATGGGLSGPAIKAMCMAKVWEVVSSVRTPVIACGGICSAGDALEYIVVGAAAFQVGSACFRDFRAPESILEGITEFCRRKGVRSVAELRGTLELPRT
ncbi:MAG: dihydroorotate dehydrogenase [Candidatus Eiseniibacteriota bacterium]|nr:MAG: dihydroorotate dehydrogenase [Candidatus Eisenbacteria bacterium]